MQRDRKKQEESRGKRVSGKYKQFNQDTYNLTAPAVDALIKWHTGWDIYVEHNHKDPYGPDAIEWYGFRPVRYLEVAQRSAWKEGDWSSRWDPVNIEERKIHLFQLSLPCDYWVVSGDYKNALKISHEVVEKYLSNTEEISNASIREGEKFVRIPLSECEQVDLTAVPTRNKE